MVKDGLGLIVFGIGIWVVVVRVWVRCKAKIKPIVLSTFTMSSARLGFELWLELGQGKLRCIRLWGWG
jgi:hypothetical protein